MNGKEIYSQTIPPNFFGGQLDILNYIENTNLIGMEVGEGGSGCGLGNINLEQHTRQDQIARVTRATVTSIHRHIL
jgi:hypothetical protein